MERLIQEQQFTPCYIQGETDIYDRYQVISDAKKAKKNPRKHQLEAIKALVKGLQGVARGKGIMPCAFGKTLTALWVMEALKSKCTIVIVPSLALLRQFKASWDENQMNHVPTLCVCSEKDIDGRDNRSGVTTNLQEVIRFLSKHKKCIVYATYQSLEVISKATKKIGYSFDFAICDEAHKTVGNSKNGLFTLIHSDKKISIKKRLYMTATPRIISDVVKGRVKYLVDMYDENIYGPELYRMSFREAIDRGILVDYKIITVGVKDSHVDSKSDAINNHALDFAMRKHDINHVLSFHSSIKKAKRFQEIHQKLYPDVFVGHINGTMSTEERLAILEQFKQARKGIITNVRALTEGVDCPMIDGVFFCDPKNSVTDIVQGAGRALRLALGKKFGYIIVPIMHNNDGDVEGEVNKSIFSNLVSVVRAMGDVDESLIDEIRNINTNRGISDLEKDCHIELLGLDWGDIDAIEIERVKRNLFTQIVSRARVPWRSYEKAREFARELDLKSGTEWRQYINGEISGKAKLPMDMPRNPYVVYGDRGWISIGDFLGTGYVASQKRVYRSYEDARIFARELNLTFCSHWEKYVRGEMPWLPKLPMDIPKSVYQYYKERGWVSYRDFLRSDIIIYRDYDNAKIFVHKLKLKSHKEWRQYVKGGMPHLPQLPSDIPPRPSYAYRRGDGDWQNWLDWLGLNGAPRNPGKHMDYTNAKKFVHKLNFRSMAEWQKYARGEMPWLPKKPKDIPVDPRFVYKNKGFINSGDWLGSGRIANYLISYKTYEDAKKFVHSLNLKSHSEWSQYIKGEMPWLPKLPIDIPAYPHGRYPKEKPFSMNDWLGTGKKSCRERTYQDYESAKKFVHTLELKSSSEWLRYTKGEMPWLPKLPVDIPAHPRHSYTGKFSYGDWLGTGRVADNIKIYKKYEDAREFARNLELKSQLEWRKYSKGEMPWLPAKPTDIPASPAQTYTRRKCFGEWRGYRDFLGTEK